MTAIELINIQREFFNKNKTQEVKYRIEQLKLFRRILKENESLLFEAIDKDFGKSQYETYITELSLIYHEINLAIKKVRKWSRPKYVWTNLANFPGKSRIIPEPFGNSLVIGALPFLHIMNLK